MTLIDREQFPSIGSGLWWAAQTVTTVGYGDNVPVSFAGRLLAVAVMLLGIGFLTVITAAITSTFVARSRARGDAFWRRPCGRGAVASDRAATRANRGRADPVIDGLVATLLPPNTTTRARTFDADLTMWGCDCEVRPTDVVVLERDTLPSE